jgi:hypothetical protein
MAENEELDLGKAFEREGAKRRFRKLVGVDEIGPNKGSGRY